MPRDPLEPVYWLIASNRYTEAIHFINKLLRKQPNFLIAKVWKCEALIGLGNISESEEIMASVIEQASADKLTQECIADFYRARCNYSKLAEVYENALKYHPNDESFRKALYECYGVAGDYKKQQQQALILYKQSPRLLFYCMAVVCLIQQSEEIPAAMELAEKMMLKQLDAGKLESKHELMLWLIVLEKRRKYEAALEVVNKFSTEFESLFCMDDKKIELFMLLERWVEALAILKRCLKEKPDSWVHYKNYLICVLRLEAAGGLPDTPDVEDSASRAMEFLDLQHKEFPKLRGPVLAKIELYKLQESNSRDELIDLITSYFQLFGDKGISMFDLAQYINLIPEESKESLLRNLTDPSWPNIGTCLLQSLIGPAKHLSFMQFSSLLGVYKTLPVMQQIDLCNDLVICYKSAEECDRKDHYLTLMTEVRMSLYRETGDGGHLVDALCHLEESLTKGPSIFAIHVLLLQLYFALGASKAARKLYEQLRIQSVQVDTLSYMFLLGISSTGHFTVALEMWEVALRILHQCNVESVEALIWSYRTGVFHQVNNLTRCARRFQHSLTEPFIRGEKAFLELISADACRAEQILSRGRVAVNWDSCIDNRDLNALHFWNLPDQQERRLESFNELLLFGRLREATVNCLSASVNYGKDRSEELKNIFKASLDELRNLIGPNYDEKSVAHNESMSVSDTRLHLVIKKPLIVLFEKILDSDVSSYEKATAILNQSTAITLDLIAGSKSKDPRKCLEAVVSHLEFLSMATILCGAARAGQQASQRRRSEPLIKCLETCWTQLEGSLHFSVPPSSYPSGSTRDLVENKLRENYQLAFDEIKKNIRKKAGPLHRLIHS